MSETPEQPSSPYLRNAAACPRCGEINHGRAKYCRKCGAALQKPPGNTARNVSIILFVFLGLPGCCTSICTYPGLIQFGPSYGYIDWTDYIVPFLAAAVFVATLVWMIRENRR